LATEIQTYLGSVRVETECAIAPSRDGYLLRSILLPPPPAAWKFTASDIVHHLRSALDNAAWHLVNLGGSPLKPLEIAFPVVDREEKWERAAQRNLAGAPRAAIDLIRTVQPFADSTDLKYSWLGLLRHLSNQDKHAELLRVNLFSPDARHRVEIEYRDELPAPPERIDQMVFGEDGVMTYVRTGGHVLNVQGNVEGRVEFILLGPDGHPFKLINGLAKLTASVRAMVHELSKVSEGKPDGMDAEFPSLEEGPASALIVDR
jgi:hypothetical protein